MPALAAAAAPTARLRQRASQKTTLYRCVAAQGHYVDPSYKKEGPDVPKPLTDYDVGTAVKKFKEDEGLWVSLVALEDRLLLGTGVVFRLPAHEVK